MCLENQEFNMEKSVEEKITGAGDMFVVQECVEDNIHPFLRCHISVQIWCYLAHNSGFTYNQYDNIFDSLNGWSKQKS